MTFPVIEFSEFKHKHDIEPLHQRLLVPDFVKALSNPDVRANKDGKAIRLRNLQRPPPGQEHHGNHRLGARLRQRPTRVE